MDTARTPLARIRGLTAGVAVFALILVIRGVSYPLFHTIAELFAIVVMSCAFMVMWNGRHYVQDQYLLLIGTSFLFIVPIDLLHMLTYSGMSLIPGVSIDMPTQFWVIARFMQASVFLLAPSFIGRSVDLRRWMLPLATITSALAISVAFGWFPSCLGPAGLTPFKRIAEVVIIAMSLAAYLRLRTKKDAIDATVFNLISASIFLGIASEVAFTLYSDPYSSANLIGHFLRIVSVYPLYRAMIARTLTQPYGALFRELELHAETLARGKNYSDAMAAIDEQINSTLEFETIAERVMRSGASAIGADSAAISTSVSGVWTVEHVFQLPRSIIGRPLTRNLGTHLYAAEDASTPLAIDDVHASRLVANDFAAEYGVHSLVTVPMRQGGSTIGMLTFHRKRPDAPFSAEDVVFADRLGHSLSLAINNAHLYAAQRTVADTLQRAMLNVADSFPGVRIAHAYRSADQIALIGGDFFDALQLSGGRIALLLGDVSGKGLQAATMSQAVRTTLQSFALTSSLPATILTDANRVLCSTMADGTFATATVAVLDPLAGTIDIASAGHPDPYLCTSQGSFSFDVHRSTPLGLFTDMTFRSSTILVQPGDTILLYSDGLLDTRRGTEFFGEQRVEELLSTLGPASPDLIVSTLISASDAFSGGRHTDDVALIALSLTA